MFASLLGNDTIGLYVCSVDLSFSSNFEVKDWELDDEDGSFETGYAVIGGLDIGAFET